MCVWTRSVGARILAPGDARTRGRGLLLLTGVPPPPPIIDIYRDLQKLFIDMRTDKAITLAAATVTLDINQRNVVDRSAPEYW